MKLSLENRLERPDRAVRRAAWLDFVRPMILFNRFQWTGLERSKFLLEKRSERKDKAFDMISGYAFVALMTSNTKFI